MEIPLFLKNKSYKLFGVLHQPEQNHLTKSSLGIVFCHPFAEEKLFAHRVMVNIARKLTVDGYYCLRFDYMGHGDSDGNFEDASIETRLSDIKCAIDYLKNSVGVKEVVLLGVRLGATLAVLSSLNTLNIKALILISPIIDGEKYIHQCLRSNLTMQIAMHKKIIKDRKALINDLMEGRVVNIDGYLLTRDFYEQLREINLFSSKLNSRQDILILSVSKKRKANINDLEELRLKYTNQGNKVELYSIEDDEFWKDIKIYNPKCKNLQQAINNWCKNTFL